MINTDAYRRILHTYIDPITQTDASIRHGIFLKIAGETYNLKKIEYNKEAGQLYIFGTQTEFKINAAEKTFRKVQEEGRKASNDVLDSPEIYLIATVRQGGNKEYLKTPLIEIQRGGLYFNLLGDDSNVEILAASEK